MVEGRRLGAESSHVRTKFIDAAEAALAEEGEHGFTARKVAARAGLKTQLLYYYFRTIDELLLAVVRRVNERRLESFEQAMNAPDPLRALWQTMTDPSAAGLACAVSAIAHHRESVRPEINRAAEKFRALQSRVVAKLIPPPEPGGLDYTAEGIVMIAAALARMLVNETAMGLTAGHAEAQAIVEQLLVLFSPAEAREEA